MWDKLDRLLFEGWLVWIIFWALCCVSAWLGIRTTGDLKTEAAPWGAVSLELAGSEGKARGIIDSWERGQTRRGVGMLAEARRHLRVDSYFIVAYSLLLAVGCLIAARELHHPQSTAFRLGLLLALLPLLAGAFDYVENSAIKRMLDGGPIADLARRAYTFASLKFAIVAVTALYALAGLGAALRRKFF
jgi:hypothetical protein